MDMNFSKLQEIVKNREVCSSDFYTLQCSTHSSIPPEVEGSVFFRLLHTSVFYTEGSVFFRSVFFRLLRSVKCVLQTSTHFSVLHTPVFLQNSLPSALQPHTAVHGVAKSWTWLSDWTTITTIYEGQEAAHISENFVVCSILGWYCRFYFVKG